MDQCYSSLWRLLGQSSGSSLESQVRPSMDIAAGLSHWNTCLAYHRLIPVMDCHVLWTNVIRILCRNGFTIGGYLCDWMLWSKYSRNIGLLSVHCNVLGDTLLLRDGESPLVALARLAGIDRVQFSVCDRIITSRVSSLAQVQEEIRGGGKVSAVVKVNGL